METTRREFLKNTAIVGGAFIVGNFWPKKESKAFAADKTRYFELPGTATDWSGEVILNPLYENKEEVSGLLSDYSNLALSDDSYSGRPSRQMVTDKIDEWYGKKKLLLFANVPRLERLTSHNNEKINFGETAGECDAKVYIFKDLPLELRKEIEREILQKSLQRGSQTVISNYWMLEAIKADINSNDPQFFELYDSIFKAGTDKKNGKKYLQNALKGKQQGAALFLRVPTHYDDTTSMCATMDYIPSLRYGDVYLYYTPVPQPKDPALKLQAKHEDISEFVRFFQRYLEDEVPSLNVLSTPYAPGENILGLPLE